MDFIGGASALRRFDTTVDFFVPDLETIAFFVGGGMEDWFFRESCPTHVSSSLNSSVIGKGDVSGVDVVL